MDQLRAIFMWILAVSVAVIIAGVATRAMTFRGGPLPARSAVHASQDSAIG